MGTYSNLRISIDSGLSVNTYNRIKILYNTSKNGPHGPLINLEAAISYSDRSTFTGLTAAARMAWTLIVASVINTQKIQASTNTHQLSPIR